MQDGLGIPVSFSQAQAFQGQLRQGRYAAAALLPCRLHIVMATSCLHDAINFGARAVSQLAAPSKVACCARWAQQANLLAEFLAQEVSLASAQHWEDIQGGLQQLDSAADLCLADGTFSKRQAPHAAPHMNLLSRPACSSPCQTVKDLPPCIGSGWPSHACQQDFG